MRLLEDAIKTRLRDGGLPVPRGLGARTPAEAAQAVRDLGGRAVVKALVAAGRRGKAGAVSLVDSVEAGAAVAERLIDSTVGGHRVGAVYVEEAVAIRAEFYLSFSFGTIVPRLLVSRSGGVDIEAAAGAQADAVIARDIDPVRGLTPWQAAAAWEAAGVDSALVPALGALTVGLYRAFQDADALMLEINPLVVTADGALSIVGAMAEIDDNALFRHPDWAASGPAPTGPDGRPLNARELAVIDANRRFPGASVRYTELDGDIGLMVSGGGAGLLQHDLVLAAGGAPSCHTDLSPTPTAEKPAALIEAIVGNPRARGLLVGFNYLQLARCDLIIEALLIALDRCGRRAEHFPVVVRLFGPGEEAARALAATHPGIDYLPAGATLADGVAAIVAAVRRVRASEGAS
ncbi:MAG: ATP-grasp domain-containing protein [Lautropia sp.]